MNETLICMEIKKAPSKDLLRFSGLFTSIGFMVSLSIVLTAFEWRSAVGPIVNLRGQKGNATLEIVDIPVTSIEPPAPVVHPVPFITSICGDEGLMNDHENEIMIVNPVPPEPEETDDDGLILYVEHPAIPDGGFEAFYKYVASQLMGKYPLDALRNEIEGLVYVQFAVERDGKLTNVHFVKGIGGGCDELAVKVVENSSPWQPGKQRGKPIRQLMTLPIRFKLN